MIYHLLILQNNRNFLQIVQNLTFSLYYIQKYIRHFPIGIKLLLQKFTLSEIHCLYETISERRPDNKNFYKNEPNEWLVLTL